MEGKKMVISCGSFLLFVAFVATEPRAEESLSNDGFRNSSRHPRQFPHPPPTAAPLIYAPLYSISSVSYLDQVHILVFWDNSHTERRAGLHEVLKIMIREVSPGKMADTARAGPRNSDRKEQ